MLITSTTNTVCLKCWLEDDDDDDDFRTILDWVTSDFYDGDPREANRDPLNMTRTHPQEPEPEPSPKRQRRT